MLMKVIVKNVIHSVLEKAGLRLVRVGINKNNRSGININVGCGRYEIPGFISVDFYTEQYYGGGNFKRTHYDMRNDDLPFASNLADTIYCSHVIEHIETNYVSYFLEQSLRVLKPGGILRIACPDSLFLYKAMKEFPQYYCWHPMYQSPDDAVKCFVDEVATHRINLTSYGLENSISHYDYGALMKRLREGGEFDENNPGRHINNWDYARLKKYGDAVGFDTVIESKHKGSCCPALQGCDMDLTHPEMSLYVDLVKR